MCSEPVKGFANQYDKTHMKTLLKLTLLAAFAATLGTGAALADDQQLQNRLAIQRAQAEKSQRTTIAVYGTRGVGRSERQMHERRAETRFELRSNAHGQQFGAYVPVK